MNGPIILNNARELLADKIAGYLEPLPAPLKISPWLAIVCCKKRFEGVKAIGPNTQRPCCC
jgi:hypothetical protein